VKGPADLGLMTCASIHTGNFDLFQAN